jgi:SpoVK/Ycf46/Vps4 family AAA+-type ATPase|tara:strand:- start:2098 stop:3273 length:1176 start_codon:yes stop_codon:yes gene_type:complete
VIDLSSAPEVLQNTAQTYAREAIKFDTQGSRGTAIQMYQKSIEALIKLTKLYPNESHTQLYIKHAKRYQERINQLQNTSDMPQDKQSDSQSGVVEIVKSSYEDVILQEKPNISWEEIVGNEDAKKALRESITFPSMRPDLFPLGWPRGILLYGPPGTGKTLLAAAVASDIDGHFMNVDASTIMSKWLGEAEQNVSKLFKSAKHMLDEEGVVSVVIFIDEVDSLFGRGSNTSDTGGESRVRNQFLKEMDSISDKGKNLALYIIGATNKPWSLDWPFLRRFQKRICVNLPSLDARVEMMEMYTSSLKVDESIKLSDIAKSLEGYSGSDIRDICQSVQLQVVSKLFEMGSPTEDVQPESITSEDIYEIMEKRKPSVSSEMLHAYSTWSDNYRAL